MAEDKGRQLKEEEEEVLKRGQDLYSMTQTEGWKEVSKWLKDMAFHSWVDPRDTDSQEQWVWRELNAFHGASVAKELLERVAQEIDEAERLQQIKKGEVQEGVKI